MDKEEKLLEIFSEYNKLFKENYLNEKWVIFLGCDACSYEDGDDGDGNDDGDD